MHIQCAQCSADFEVTEDDLDLLKKCSPEIGDRQYALPTPSLCFDCRLQRRLAFYNSRTLYKRTSDLSQKPIVSIFSPDKPFRVFERREWYGDEWDPLEYGKPFDFTRPFFEQFRELMEAVPQLSLAVLTDNVNSDFANDNMALKNCYLVFDGERGEDSMYGHTFAGIRTCIDFLSHVDCELCYECLHCEDCYNCKYTRYSMNCSDSWFLRDCIGCKNCFGCANLRQKQYCIYNEQKTKEEYEIFIQNIHSGSYRSFAALQNKVNAYLVTQPVKATRGEQNIGATGDNLNQSKDSHDCFDCYKMQDCAYCTNCLIGAKDCGDVHIWGDSMELCYNCCVAGVRVRNLVGCYYVSEGCDNVLYSMYCSRQSHDLFGCIGLRHKQYCIFNVQYTKDEYNDLATKIIEHMQNTGEWGEFFPPKISAFGYNETMAQTFFPLTKQEVENKGWQWCDYQVPVEAEKSLLADQLPDEIHNTPDDILNWAIECEVSGKPYKITKQELDFYRTHQLPVPRRHPDQRHKDRFAYKNPYRLWKRECSKCKKEIQTSYSEDRPEKVLCEECYLAEVY